MYFNDLQEIKAIEYFNKQLQCFTFTFNTNIPSLMQFSNTTKIQHNQNYVKKKADLKSKS